MIAAQAEPAHGSGMTRPTSNLPAHNPVLAATLITVSTAFIAASTLLAKSLGTGRLGSIDLGTPLPVLQISFGRFFFAFVVVMIAALVLRMRLARVHVKLHLGRTVCGWAGVTLMFAAVAFIPLSDATAISFLNPVFCMILAIPFLGERVGLWRWVAAGIAMLGALILLRPGVGSFQPMALLALGAAMIMGAELILIKRLSRLEKPLQILLLNNALGLVIASVAASFVWHSMNLLQWVVLAGVGICMVTAQGCFVNGMARGDASFVAPFGYATLVFAALYDGVIFGVVPDGISFVGAAVILGGAALQAWRETLAAKRGTNAPSQTAARE